jgi:hypothetical protein
MFVSPDGKAVELIITRQRDPASVEGIAHARDFEDIVAYAIKATPLSNAKVCRTGEPRGCVSAPPLKSIWCYLSCEARDTGGPRSRGRASNLSTERHSSTRRPAVHNTRGL